MNSYFRTHFPATVRRFGDPLLFGAVPNPDTMAFALNESPARVVFYQLESRFYFWERAREAYTPVVPEARLVAFIRAIIRRALRDTPRELAAAVWLVWNDRQLEQVINRARAILATDDQFFSGETGMRRFIGGRIVEPVEHPSYSLFAEQAVEPRSGAILTSGEAYHRYWSFCRPRNLTPLRRTMFKERFTNETLSRWGIGMRHDLVVPRENNQKPKICQGWQGIAVRAESGLN